MKLTSYFLILGLATILLACSNPAPNSKEVEANPPLTEKSLLEAIQEFNKAFQEGNVEKLSYMITEDYMHTNSSSKSFGRERWLNFLQGRQEEIASGQLIVSEYVMDQVEIKVYGNTGILTARMKESSEYNGEKQYSEVRITNLWVNEGGKWKRAGFHDNKIP